MYVSFREYTTKERRKKTTVEVCTIMYSQLAVAILWMNEWINTYLFHTKMLQSFCITSDITFENISIAILLKINSLYNISVWGFTVTVYEVTPPN